MTNSTASTATTVPAVDPPGALDRDLVDEYLDLTVGFTIERVLRDRDAAIVGDGSAALEPSAAGRARCADGNGTLTHLFFSDDDFDLARAKAICGKCSLQAACLSGALDRQEFYGVWGGELLIEGQVVAMRPRRGRPPKTPRPVLVVDEVPLPPHLVA